MTAIRKHLRDFIAVIGLALIGLVIGWIIVQQERLRVPVLEERPFQLKAELETGQSITPGQGQTVRVAGVRVGDISKVELEDGLAVVTMDIDRKFLPIYRDATVLLRPKTGLKDMFLEMDPGTAAAGEFEEDDSISVANTAPDVNLDEVLEALDGDTRAYLRTLLVSGGEALNGNGRNLGKLLGSLGPINRSLARLNREVATRRQNLANLIHNLNILTGRLGDEAPEIAALIDSSNSALGAIASQDANVQRATALLPGTLRDTRTTLSSVDEMAKVLGPTFRDLRPFARRLDEINKTTRNLAKTATPALRDEIRPFVRSARAPVRDLGPAAQSLATATPDLTTVASKINRLGNMAAFNPNGAEGCPGGVCPAGRDEGYLYWAAWLAHNGNSVFSIQDAHGLLRRIYFTAPCETLIGLINMSPLGPTVGAITEGIAGLFNNLPPIPPLPPPLDTIPIPAPPNPAGAPCSLP